MPACWRVFHDMAPTADTNSAFAGGLVSEWIQASGHAVFGGQTSMLRVWDVRREASVQEIMTDTAVLTIAAEKEAGHLLMTGSTDGKIRVLDRRQRRRCVQHCCQAELCPSFRS